MNKLKVNPRNLKGRITVPPSKSMCHRAVICASLSEEISEIYNLSFSDDINATLRAVEGLGVSVKKESNFVEIEGLKRLKVKNEIIDCFESGSTLRFLIPIAATLGEKVTFVGSGKLGERPLNPYYEIFNEQNINYKNNKGKLPLIIKGKLKSGKYEIRGDVSSQFISGLLFSLPLLDGDSKILITTELESKPYVDLTIDMLKRFSVCIQNNDYKEFIIKGNQTYSSSNYKVEGDFSQAAFWITAGILGEKVICDGLNIDSLQGDKEILSIMKNMGGEILIEKDRVISIPSKTKGTIIDASECPDLVPILAVLAALSEGTTEIINAQRLRIKESDRLEAISNELNKIGADIQERKDGLIIKGKEKLNGGEVSSWNDHRIAMALAVASIRCTQPVIIRDPLCVKKSYPNFWEHFKILGGDINEWNLGE